MKLQRILTLVLLAALAFSVSPAPAHAANEDNIVEAESVPGKSNVAYHISFTTAVEIPDSTSGGAVKVGFPADYQKLHPEAANLQANATVSSKLNDVYSNYVMTSLTKTDTTLLIGLDQSIPAGSYVTVGIEDTAGITNPASGNYTFQAGQANDADTIPMVDIPFAIIAGSAVSNFSVSTTAVPHFTNYQYYGIPDDLYTYTFAFTPVNSLDIGDQVFVHVPNGFTNINSFYWFSGTIGTDLVTVTTTDANGPATGTVSSASYFFDDQWRALSFTLSQPINAGTQVDIALSGFLRTPDRVYEKPGPHSFEIYTSKDPIPTASTLDIYSYRVSGFYPDADTYASGAATGLHFKFMVMQPIRTTNEISIQFPDGMTVPSGDISAYVKLNNAAVSSAVMSGNTLAITPSSELPSFSSAQIDIDQAAGFKNTPTAGYRTFAIGTDVDNLTATRVIGIVSPTGPSLEANYINNENGILRIVSTASTILKAGDTVTVTSPAGTKLSNPGMTQNDIVIEWFHDEGTVDLTPASFTRISDHAFTFTLPEPYFVDPDYALTFRIPNVILPSGYGQYLIQVNTNYGAVPASFMLESLAPIDLNNDGSVRIDEVLQYIRDGVTLDRTGDGRFDADDVKMLLQELTPVSTS